MISFEDINTILDNVVSILKSQVVVNSGNVTFKDGIVRIDENYIKAAELWDEVRVHSEGLHFPESLFKSKAPNENPEMYKYRQSIYQPITKTDWRRGINNYNRVFNPQNYSVDGWGNDTGIYKDDTAEDYFTKKYPNNRSIFTYFRQVVKAKKLEDPNAVIALDFDANEFEKPDTEIIEPVGNVFHTDRVFFHNKQFTLIWRHEKSVVNHYKTDREMGFIFWLYDDTKIYRMVQTGKFSDYEFEIDILFSHDLGYVPVERLGGVMLETDLFQSHAMDAVYPLNDVLFDNSTLSASKVKHAYPQDWMFDDQCANTNCVDGYVPMYGDDGNKTGNQECEMCKGSGRLNHNPLTTHIIKRMSGMEDGEPTPTPPLGYVQMNPEILEFLRKEITTNKQESFSFLGVDISSTNAKGSETALGKIIDRETLFSSLLDFSNEVWDLIAFNIDFVGRVRYKQFENPEVNRPVNFAIRNERDLTAEYSEAKDLPDVYTVSILNDLINARFANNKQLKRIVELKQQIDRLFSLTTDQAGLKKAQGLASAWEVILHDSFDTYIAQKINEDPDYLKKEDDDIKVDMETMAKEDVPAITNSSTQQIIGND